MALALYLYIRSTHNICGRILCTHNNNGPYARHRRHAVVARANQCRGTIDPIAPRPYSEIDLTLQCWRNIIFHDHHIGDWITTIICNCLRNCLTQCYLACTVWIHWAATLQRTISTLSI